MAYALRADTALIDFDTERALERLFADVAAENDIRSDEQLSEFIDKMSGHDFSKLMRSVIKAWVNVRPPMMP